MNALTTSAQEITSSMKVLPPATKYRVAIRFIAVDNGWEFEQISPRVDRFTKGNTIIDVEHGPRDLIVHAERAAGNSTAKVGKKGKMFTVQAWLTGVPDPINPATGKGSRFIRLSDEQVAKYESGKGYAKIDQGVEANPAPVTTAPKKAPAKPVVKAEAPAPKPKPAPRAAKTAVAVKVPAEY